MTTRMQDGGLTRVTRASEGLVIRTDLRMAAQHSIEGCEHVAHAGLRGRAFDHDDELGLVGGGAYQTPGAILKGDPHPIHGNEVSDLLAGYRLVRGAGALEVPDHRVDDLILAFVFAVWRHGGRLPGLW